VPRRANIIGHPDARAKAARLQLISDRLFSAPTPFRAVVAWGEADDARCLISPAAEARLKPLIRKNRSPRKEEDHAPQDLGRASLLAEIEYRAKSAGGNVPHPFLRVSGRPMY
jgi:hypothetical protein